MRIFLAVIALAACVCGTSEAQTRPALRVQDFKWDAVKKAVRTTFGSRVDFSGGITALIVKRLAQDSQFIVLRDRDFDRSNRLRQGAAARIGRNGGADYSLVGEILDFHLEDERTIINGRIIPPDFGGDTVPARTVVVFQYHVIDNESSKVVFTDVVRSEIRGEISNRSKGLGDVFRSLRGVDLTNPEFAQTMIGKATIDACDKLAQTIHESMFLRAPRKVEAYVSEVTGSVVAIAAGSANRVKVGDRFEVFHIISEIKDPITGEVLDTDVVKTGELTINEVRERGAYGSYIGSPVAPKTFFARKIEK